MAICAKIIKSASANIDYAKLALFLVPSILTFFYFLLLVYNDSWGHLTAAQLFACKSHS